MLRTLVFGLAALGAGLVDKDIVGNSRCWFRLTIDVHKGVAAHICHTGTAEHPTLGVFQRTRGIRIQYSTDVAGFHRHLGAALHLCLIATAIHITANLYLSLNIED